MFPWLGTIFGNRPSLNDSFSACTKQKLKRRAFNLYRRTRKKSLNSWSHAAEEVYPSSVGSEETTYSIFSAGNTSQFIL